MFLNVLAEGYTEQKFAETLLAPHLASKNIFVRARCVKTRQDDKRGRVYRGGISSYVKVRNDLLQWLKECPSSDFRFTTMFDYYALPKDFPGFEQAQNRNSVFDKVHLLEEEFRKDIGDWRFVPYIQVHEFEALLFVEPECLSPIYFDEEAFAALKNISTDFENPELIDNGWETAPSKRILKVIPDYDKVTAGVDSLKRVGIEKLTAKCLHFAEWVGKWEGN